MDSRSCNTRFGVEPLEDRRLMSTVAYGDFNNDGRVDMAAVTNPTTITVSLLNSNGSYTVSATLTTPRNQPATGVGVQDVNGDGRLDISSGGGTNLKYYSHIWLGNGNGTFGNRVTDTGRFPKWFV